MPDQHRTTPCPQNLLGNSLRWRVTPAALTPRTRPALVDALSQLDGRGGGAQVEAVQHAVVRREGRFGLAAVDVARQVVLARRGTLRW